MPEGRRDISLLSAVGVFVALLVVLATGAVALSSYITGKDLSERLLADAERNLTRLVSERTKRFLEPAEPYLKQTLALVERGYLDPHNHMEVLRYLHGALLAHKNFSWAAWGGADGCYLAAYRRPQAVHATERTPLDPNAEPHKDNLAHYRQFVCTADVDPEHWQLVEEFDKSYDPRPRPWYRGAVDNPGGAWVGPYLFFTDLLPGVTYVKHQPADDGKGVAGVWCVDYELRTISSDFLSKLKIFESGRVYVLDGKGQLVGHPLAGQAEGPLRIADEKESLGFRTIHASEHPDAMLRDAWPAMGGRAPTEPANFTYGPYLGFATPLHMAGGADWFVLIAVPREEVYGPIEKDLARAGWIALACLILGVFLGLVAARLVARTVRRLTDELGAISRLELSPRTFAEQPGLIREFNRIGDATDTMKTGIRSFARYVPSDLVQELLGGGLRAELGGEKRRMTALFADIANFTTIAETMPPDQLVRALEQFFDVVIETIRAHQGTIDKLMGDGIMAFWGAPRPLPSHASEACAAALKVRDAVRTFGSTGPSGLPLRVRVGINSGEMLVGNVGSKDRMDYTVMGDAVNLASRLEGLGKLYTSEVLIGEDTASELDDSFVVRPIDWVAVKGRTNAVLVYELVDRADHVDEKTRTRLDRYTAALERYRQAEFEAALAGFEALDDAPAGVMAARCRQFIATPPPPEWSGVWDL